MKINLQRIITPSIAVAALTYIGSFIAWIGLFILYRHPYPMPGYVGHFAEDFLSSRSLLAHLISFAVTVLNSMIIAQMNNKFSFIRTRTFMPTFIYLLISSFWLPIHGNYVAAIASFFILVTVFLTLQMYKERDAVEKAFLSSIFIAFSVLMVPEYAVLVLIFWIGYGVLKAWSYRVFFASVIGLITPLFLIYGTAALVFNKVDILPDIQGIIYQYSFFEYNNIASILYFGIMFVIFSITMVGMSYKTNQDVIQTRNELLFFRLLAFALLLLLVFRFSNYTSYLPLVAVIYAIMTSYAFTLIRNLFYSIVFILLCLVSFIFAFYHVFL